MSSLMPSIPSESTTRVYFVRHGRTPANDQNLVQGSADAEKINDLNEQGRAEVKTTATKLQEVSFDIFYSSPLRRAQETCKIFRKAVKIAQEQKQQKPILDDRIVEGDFGEWEGRTWEDFDKNEIEARTHMEPEEKFKGRVSEFLQEIGEKHLGKTLLVSSHGGWMRNVLILTLNLKCGINDIRLRNAGYFMLEYSTQWTLGTADGLVIPTPAEKG